jgi:ABC-type lipoprotein release transport system permease subunit
VKSKRSINADSGISITEPISKPVLSGPTKRDRMRQFPSAGSGVASSTPIARRLAFDVSATDTDPVTVAAALILAAGALAAAFIPASRASNVSPTDALRLELCQA